MPGRVSLKMSHRDSLSDRRLNLECRSKAAVLYRTFVQTSNKNCYGPQKNIGSSCFKSTSSPSGQRCPFRYGKELSLALGMNLGQARLDQ